MKKIISIIAICVITTICIFTLSCENNSINECKTCNSDDFVKIKVNVFDDNLEFKKYDNDNNDFHLGLSVLNTEDFNSFSKNLKEKTNIEFNDSELVGFCLVTKKSDNYSANNDNIDGVFLYTLNRKKKMRISFFRKENTEFIENKLSNIQIGCITTNNIFDLTTIFFDNNEKMVYLGVSQKYKVDTNSNNKEIDSKLSILKSNFSLNKTAPKSCGLGCKSNDGSRCALGDSGKFFCKEDENCPKDEAQKTLVNADISSYNYSQITEDLYYFRGNYLKEFDGGQKIIDDYYDLGKNLPLSFYTIENCIKLFDLLSSDVTKITNDLAENPNGKEILINNELNIKLTNYLLNIKEEYPDKYSKDKIDKLINKLDFFTNKSNDYITTNLNSY